MVINIANFAYETNEYNIFSLAKIGMQFRNQRYNGVVQQRKLSQKSAHIAENIQALPNLQKETPHFKVQFGTQILISFSGSFSATPDPQSWIWREEWSARSSEIPRVCDSRTDLLLSSPKSNSSTEPDYPSPQKSLPMHEEADCMEETLYKEDQVGLLKKDLQLKYKGLLSKSTDSNPTLGIPILFNFRCKNSTHNNCPFLHTLEYFKEVDGQVYYRHITNNSYHLPECILDSENIQYNIIMRKIDYSMSNLSTIIQDNPLLKPKDILQLFASSIGELDEGFLYEGLQTRNARRSIKKYFDNAIAKVKARLRP